MNTLASHKSATIAQAHSRERRPWLRGLWISLRLDRKARTNHHCVCSHQRARIKLSPPLSKASLCRNTLSSQKTQLNMVTKKSNFHCFSAKYSAATTHTIYMGGESWKQRAIQSYRSVSECFAEKATVSSLRFNSSLNRNCLQLFHRATKKSKNQWWKNLL